MLNGVKKKKTPARKKSTEKSLSLDTLLDSPKKTKCTTCIESKRDPQFAAALDRYLERKREGTTAVGHERFLEWLHENGIATTIKISAITNHFRVCSELRSDSL